MADERQLGQPEGVINPNYLASIENARYNSFELANIQQRFAQTIEALRRELEELQAEAQGKNREFGQAMEQAAQKRLKHARVGENPQQEPVELQLSEPEKQKAERMRILRFHLSLFDDAGFVAYNPSGGEDFDISAVDVERAQSQARKRMEDLTEFLSTEGEKFKSL